MQYISDDDIAIAQFRYAVHTGGVHWK